MTTMNDDFVFVYTLMCIIREIDETSTKISFELNTFEDVFSNKIAITLSSHDEHDHVINFMSKKSFSFESLYNMFQTKFDVLQKYIRENLTLNRIKHSIVDVDASILFT